MACTWLHSSSASSTSISSQGRKTSNSGFIGFKFQGLELWVHPADSLAGAVPLLTRFLFRDFQLLGSAKKSFRKVMFRQSQGASAPCHYHILQKDPRLVKRGVALDDSAAWIHVKPSSCLDTASCTSNHIESHAAMNSTGFGYEKAADRFLDHVLMLKDGTSLCLGCMLYCDLSAREPMSSSVLAVWRSESSEEFTAHYEVLCSDPAGLAVAIAIDAMFLEHRPRVVRSGSCCFSSAMKPKTGKLQKRHRNRARKRIARFCAASAGRNKYANEAIMFG